MAWYSVSVRKEDQVTEHLIEAGSWPLASVRAIREAGGGVVTDVQPIRGCDDIVEVSTKRIEG